MKDQKDECELGVVVPNTTVLEVVTIEIAENPIFTSRSSARIEILSLCSYGFCHCQLFKLTFAVMSGYTSKLQYPF